MSSNSFDQSSADTSHEAAQHALNSFVTVLHEPQSDFDLKTEINYLGTSVGELSLKFAGVYMALTNVISSSRISGDMRQKLDHVRVKWEAVIDILADSIKQSGKLAELAVSTCKEFIERILPHLANDSASFQSRKDIVDQFAQRQEGGVEQAAKMSQGFSDIKTGIQNLVEDVQAILDGYDLSGAERRIKGLDAEIRGIMNDMEGIRQEIASVTKQLDIVIAATSATAIIGVICPVWWIATAVSAAKIPSLKARLSSLQSQQAEKAEECRKKTEERNRLQGEVVFIAALRGAVEERKPEIDDVLAKLGTLATVWAAIRADSQALLGKLERAADSQSQKLFKLRVRTAEEMYRKLHTALEAYRDCVSMFLEESE